MGKKAWNQPIAEIIFDQLLLLKRCEFVWLQRKKQETSASVCFGLNIIRLKLFFNKSKYFWRHGEINLSGIFKKIKVAFFLVLNAAL